MMMSAVQDEVVIVNLKFDLVVVFSLEPEDSPFCGGEGVHPQEKSHAFVEWPFIVRKQHLNTFILMIVYKVYIWHNVSFL